MFKQAHQWLTYNGYNVVLYKPTAQLTMQADDSEYERDLTADFLVRRGRQEYIVIVKRGKKWNARITSRTIQRQLLELHSAFAGRPVLFLELKRDRAREIAYSAHTTRQRTVLVVAGIAAAVSLIGLVWWAT
jgi:hypothetical protein